MKLSLGKIECSTLLRATCSANDSALRFEGVEFDSRRIKSGQLFVALKGATMHGEKFLEQVFASGAALALVENKDLLNSSPYKDRLLVVPDSLKAFWELGLHWRRKCNLPVLAITGSLGKTTSKEIARHLLAELGVGAYSEKSFNNQSGVPYTICNADDKAKWLVLEMGMNHAGELRELSKIGEPNVVVITSVAPAHIEYFENLSAIADAKCEIFDGLKAGGCVVLNRDISEIMQGYERWQKRNKRKLENVRTFSTSAGADLVLGNLKSDGLKGISLSLTLGGESVSVQMNLIGIHNATNVAAAVLGAKTLCPGLTLDMVKRALEKMESPAMRLNIKKLSRDRILIDDSYNSNPVALNAAFEILKEEQNAGRKVAAIIGDMRELGKASEQYHREAGIVASSIGLSYLVTVGEDAKFIAEEAKKRGVDVEIAKDAVHAAELVKQRGFQVLLIKASRGVALEKAVELLETAN